MEPTAVGLVQDMSDARERSDLSLLSLALHAERQEGTNFKTPHERDGNPATGEIADFARPLNSSRARKRLASAFPATWVPCPGTAFDLVRVPVRHLFKASRLEHGRPRSRGEWRQTGEVRNGEVMEACSRSLLGTTEY
jgi:hypothetical protein